MGELTNQDRSLRYTSLDALRGVAATVVLLHHCFLSSPDLAITDAGGVPPSTDVLVWWLGATPLRLLWAGQDAVFVFFVLSGFVLALPFLGGNEPRWGSYFAKRALRIYLPVWASIVFALAAAWLSPRTAGPSLSLWLNGHDEAPYPLRDMLLVLGTGQLNSPLWSLRWELVFSLSLPVYCVAAIALKRLWLPGIVLLLAATAGGELAGSAALACLPIFGIGVLMARHRDELERWAGKLGSWSWRLLIAASLFLLSSRWLFPHLAGTMSTSVLGAAMVVFIFFGHGHVKVWTNRRLFHWLGSRSFSLYLVHEPIVVSWAFVLHTGDSLQIALLAVPSSLLAAEVFYRLIENPSQQFAVRIGRRIAGRAGGQAKTVAPA
ncbi:acyltransferase [Arthrobacter sp. SLBN-112]|uniref:acyltransferase family protein n=1 Tax=Arthrobacter sp. SLBN-112 TaxID=2768452 RepID=UPI0027B6B525|nr:acyltransferase [Arthrobacter sp. SLBN-112]MDQ0800408.1 peptidoglycan/LPS O-acetylase OafA/YrhL [Arthrobacter sp. SLBN-112]